MILEAERLRFKKPRERKVMPRLLENTKVPSRLVATARDMEEAEETTHLVMVDTEEDTPEDPDPETDIQEIDTPEIDMVAETLEIDTQEITIVEILEKDTIRKEMTEEEDPEAEIDITEKTSTDQDQEASLDPEEDEKFISGQIKEKINELKTSPKKND